MKGREGHGRTGRRGGKGQALMKAAISAVMLDLRANSQCLCVCVCVCACVCVRRIGAVMSDSVAQRSLSSLMACLRAARSGHFTST